MERQPIFMNQKTSFSTKGKNRFDQVDLQIPELIDGFNIASIKNTASFQK